MKTSIIVPFFLGINALLFNTTCAQVGGGKEFTGCNILAIEELIDSIESLTWKVDPRGLSLWGNVQRPSTNLSIRNSCETHTINYGSEDLKLYNEIKRKVIEKYLAVLTSKHGEFNKNKQVINQSDFGENNISDSDQELSGSPENELSQNEDDFQYNEISSSDQQSDFDAFTTIYGPKNKKYSCVIIDPKSKVFSIEFLWKGKLGQENYQLLRSFDRAITYINTQLKKETVMLMNAGIFAPGFKPIGLFCQNGKSLVPFNNSTGIDGNFYLEPNGVFYIDKEKNAKIIQRKAFAEKIQNPAFNESLKNATQSGPMLVIDGLIHPKFNKKSPNALVRNGVGVMPNGNIVFILSESDVTFYEFAMLFLKGFNCQNALYLDGTISRMYAPKLHKLDKFNGAFAGIIAICKSK